MTVVCQIQRCVLGPRRIASGNGAMRDAGAPGLTAHSCSARSYLPASLPFPLEKDKRSDHDILSASRVGGSGRVNTSGMEGPARHRPVGHRIVAFQHRDLVALLLREPVPLVVGAVGEA